METKAYKLNKLLPKLLDDLQQNLKKDESVHIYDLCKKYNLDAEYATPLAVRLSNIDFLEITHTPYIISPYHHVIKKL